jgi:hypothetical protein
MCPAVLHGIAGMLHSLYTSYVHCMHPTSMQATLQAFIVERVDLHFLRKLHCTGVDRPEINVVVVDILDSCSILCQVGTLPAVWIPP